MSKGHKGSGITIKELLLLGKTKEEIIDIKGCSQKSILNVMREIGMAPKNQKDLDIGKINALWRGGWAVHKIADEMREEDGVIAGILGVRIP